MAFLAVSLSGHPALAQNFSFGRVAVEGNQRIEAGTILEYAEIPQGQAISAGGLNAAYQRLVDSGLFETVELVPQGGTLLIRVEERPTINVVAIEGNSRVGDEQIMTVVQSQPSRVFSPTLAEADAQRIVEAYRVQGRLAATVRPQIIQRSENRVDLVFVVTEGRVVENERLSFVGNRAFSDRRLRRVIETKQAGLLRFIIGRDVFVPERLEIDRQLLTDFYRSRGFIDFRVLDVNAEYSRERNATFVTWHLQEGQRFSFGRITASSEYEGLSAAEYLAVNRIRSGQTYSPVALENTIARMERLAIQQGRDFVRVEPRITRNDRSQTLDVNFVISRGPRVFVERIDIEGNQTTLDRVVRRQFTTVEGDPFNPREIRASAERLRAIGYFSNVNVDTRPGSSAEQVVVDVDVEEQPTGSLTFGASYSADTGVGIAIGFAERNFLGRGQSLVFNLNTGVDNATSQFVFAEPYLLGRDLRFRFSAIYATTDQENSYYNTELVAVEPSINFPISENGRLTLLYRLAKDNLFDVADGSSFILKQEEEEGALWTSAVGYEFSWDTRRTGLNPTAGVMFSFGQDFAGLGGDNQYIRTEAELTGQMAVWNEEVDLRATLQGGALHMLGGQDSRVTQRYFVSSNDMRGFEYRGMGPRDLNVDNEDFLGGNYYSVLSFEAAFPLGLPDEYGITGGAFIDFGSVWGLDDVGGGPTGDDPVDDSFYLRSTVGLSIFWTTPFGPLRFNFSTPLIMEDYDEPQYFNFAFQTQF